MRAARLRLPAWTGTLHWKFAIFVTGICCLLAVLLGTLVHVQAGADAENQARSEALDRLNGAVAAYTAGEPLDPHAAVDPSGLPAGLRHMVLTRREWGSQLDDHLGRPVVWAAAPASGGKVLAVRQDYSSRAAAVRRLDQSIVLSSVIATGITLVAGMIAVSSLTWRLRRAAEVARRISNGDLQARVNDPRALRSDQNRDEALAVGVALDAMAATVEDKLRSEQRFTADVAHELRTPLAGLLMASELLEPGRATDMVRDRIQTLRGLTEDLLEISRLDARVERAELDTHKLGPLARHAARATGQEVAIRVVQDAYVQTDQRRLERVLGNLVVNAHKHGRAPVELSVDGPVVTVRDHGDGYPDHLLDHGPQRFRSESHGGRKGGHGLGLTIALGQARVLDATLEFSNAPDGGAVATLCLPAKPSPAAGPDTDDGRPYPLRNQPD
ncbi:sensor histidine kinase [Streptomyces coffeae]|uniref:histidine kinase n=1 Tax=Streptomyces coffeae TaxID=621382 RepID=A0ABS1NS61_9ACTN|nr:HAMP domain-containing sensor histidine kinase [Streptomyces coffeae]MBL1102779.1 HAMP domain-containing histidine kinase [Streptomyces coffeae]